MWIELNKKANYKILVFWIIIMDDKAEQKKIIMGNSETKTTLII